MSCSRRQFCCFTRLASPVVAGGRSRRFTSSTSGGAAGRVELPGALGICLRLHAVSGCLGGPSTQSLCSRTGHENALVSSRIPGYTKSRICLIPLPGSIARLWRQLRGGRRDCLTLNVGPCKAICWGCNWRLYELILATCLKPLQLISLGHMGPWRRTKSPFRSMQDLHIFTTSRKIIQDPVEPGRLLAWIYLYDQLRLRYNEIVDL